MKTIRNWNDLSEYGIRCLTGEACLLGCRALCDLTEQGRDLVREFLGLPYNAAFQDSWNSGAVASCFLPWGILPDLAAFLLVKECGKMAVQIHGDGVWSPEQTDTDEEWNKILEFYKDNIIRWYKPLNHRGIGLSAEHAASGRSQ